MLRDKILLNYGSNNNSVQYLNLASEVLRSQK